MSKFHVNKHGVPAPCKATKGNCPLGGDESHFDSKEEAQEYADKQNEKEYGVMPGMKSHGEISQKEIEEYERKQYAKGNLRYADEDEKADLIESELYGSFAKTDGLVPGTKEYRDTVALRSHFEDGAGVYDLVDIVNDSSLSASEAQSQIETTLEDYFPMRDSEITVRHRPRLFRESVNKIMMLRKPDTEKQMKQEAKRREMEKANEMKSKRKTHNKKPRRPKEETIISAEDDVVVVRNSKTGEVLYKGLEDYEPGKKDNWKYNDERGVYTVTVDGVEYEKEKLS